jgi:hypothetical protein
MSAFTDIIYTIGIENLRYILPFLLVFTLVFSVLEKTKILGEGKKQFNVVVSLVLATAFVVPSITGQYAYQNDPVRILNDALPGVSLVAVAILMVLLTVGVFGKTIDVSKNNVGGVFLFISIAAVATIFGIAAGWFRDVPYWLSFLTNTYNQTLIVSLLVMGGLIYFIVRDPNQQVEEEPGFFDKLRDLTED